MASSLPLSALLSQALVAFTIEFDNEFEHQMPHRTTNHGSTPGAYGPWLVSLVMWSNCMQFIGDQGVQAGELEKLARTPTNLNGMERWGYISVAPGGAKKLKLIRVKPAGRKAQEIWRPLFGVIESRWQSRFGNDTVNRLRQSLLALIVQMDLGLPDCLPILKYGLFSGGPAHKTEAGTIDTSLPLSALLSRVLLAFAIEFERESKLSIAISANALRVLDENGIPVRNLPTLSGVSKESLSMALGILQKADLIAAAPGRTKAVCLTAKGKEAQATYSRLVSDIEERWQSRFGQENVRALRQVLQDLPPLRLFEGLEPYPEGWRAAVHKPKTLPHYPMVLHRGGFPDGS